MYFLTFLVRINAGKQEEGQSPSLIMSPTDELSPYLVIKGSREQVTPGYCIKSACF